MVDRLTDRPTIKQIVCSFLPAIQAEEEEEEEEEEVYFPFSSSSLVLIVITVLFVMPCLLSCTTEKIICYFSSKFGFGGN
jgi:hypothetical protein